jgi:hypothetical protein
MAADKGNELNAVVVTGMSSKKNVGQCNRGRVGMAVRATEGRPAQTLWEINIFAAGSLPVALFA